MPRPNVSFEKGLSLRRVFLLLRFVLLFWRRLLLLLARRWLLALPFRRALLWPLLLVLLFLALLNLLFFFFMFSLSCLRFSLFLLLRFFPSLFSSPLLSHPP